MDFHYSVVTDKTIDEAVDSLENALKENEFGVLWKMDLPAKLHEKGVELDMQYRILEVCNPHEAKRVLTQNPLVGYFLPCKVVVYGSGGKTYIGLPKPTSLMEVLNDPALMDVAQDVEATLKRAVDEAK